MATSLKAPTFPSSSSSVQTTSPKYARLRRASSPARENSPASKTAAQAYIARSASESPLQDVIY